MPATNPVELQAKRRLLAEYLKEDHVMIALKRPAIVSTPAGGKKRGAPATLPEQMFRMYPIVRRQGEMTRDTPDGDIINYKYVLVGFHTADVKAADYFELNNKMYDVVSVEPHNEDRIWANVTYRGLASDESWD